MLLEKCIWLSMVMLGILRLMVLAASLALFGMLQGLLLLIMRLFPCEYTSQRIVRLVTMYYYRFVLFVGGINIHHHTDPSLLKKLDQPFLLVANHISYLDILVIGALAPVGFIAKSEVASWPLLGVFARMMHTIFVERGSVVGRVRTIQALRKNIAHTPYCVFPEGTTSAQTIPVKHCWQDGSFAALKRSCATLVCMGLIYDDHDKTAWIDDETLAGHLMSFIMQPKTDVFVSFSVHDMTPQRTREIREISRSARTIVTSHCQELCYSRAKLASMAAKNPLATFLGQTMAPSIWR